MKNLIKIEIKDSFNKKDNSRNKDEEISNYVSTLNNTKNILETYSSSVGSITGHHLDGSINIVKNQGNGIWREIIIGTASAVFGAIITYFIFGN